MFVFVLFFQLPYHSIFNILHSLHFLSQQEIKISIVQNFGKMCHSRANKLHSRSQISKKNYSQEMRLRTCLVRLSNSTAYTFLWVSAGLRYIMNFQILHVECRFRNDFGSSGIDLIQCSIFQISIPNSWRLWKVTQFYYLASNVE